MENGRFYRHPYCLDTDIFVLQIEPGLFEWQESQIGIVWVLQRNHNDALSDMEWYPESRLSQFKMIK